MVILPLAVSMGEPAGIGPDIILQAWQALRTQDDAPTLLVFGDATLFEARAAKLGIDCPVHRLDAVPTDLPTAYGLAVVHVGEVPDQPGVLDPQTGAITVATLEAALQAVRDGLCFGLVTAPIHKANLYATGFGFPGHTEFLEDYARKHWPNHHPQAVMMLAGPELRTVPVTVHVPLCEVPGTLSKDQIEAVARVTAQDLRARFGIDQPRLAIAGLNPHAGEKGALGKEDDAMIAPAIEALRAEGLDVFGPLPADTMFHAEARETYDAALCMYHDQALVPVKTLDFHGTVNVTLGLPFVRTSPDHGTALGLAGTGKASPQSMIEAIKLAARLSEADRNQ